MSATSGRLTILHVTAPGRVGGLEKVVAALSIGHARAGHDVHVAAVVESGEAGDHFLSPISRDGVHTHPIVLPPRSYRAERSRVRELCRTVNPLIVHTHGYRADVIGAGGARSEAIPVVTTVHGFTGGGWRNRLYEALQVRAFRRFDGVVAVSEPLAALLRRRGVPGDRLRVIVNGWSPGPPPLERRIARAQLALPAEAFCIGWIGRVTHEKGADIMVDAATQLDANMICSFIGDGRERQALEVRARTLGVADRVRWHGIVHDAGTLLRAFDAFVLSSRTEGTPIVLFEAMAAGVPVIATRVGGVPDVVTESEAILVPPEDPAAVARAVRDVCHNPASAAARARAAGRRLSDRFALSSWLREYEALYRELVAARNAPPRETA